MLAKLAQEIVNITSEGIGHDVLITDKDGMVLDSSDKPGNSCWGTPQSGRTIETLGLSKLSKEEIMDFVRTGTPKVSA
ncbi:hypothetical protein ASG97_10300 [Bacillus sp. Soil745]|uniref:sugar diacid recognition domain-containing protein n=1 Tax=Peribacillus frigoritolerans TaxID=450367 RepID=UPI000710179E|nr:sugar diacid recognition domain-containing protein [Peribacillus frigoritolerans]KRF50544.1 hypothetical protein ASG97_10300 [Bacillus sp. Soil745]MED3707941.1 sugar diacid recognition domain-containing protein [Peribacillus frigoritolerans]PAW26657.1 hypothetical protein BKC07_23365 [Peribacillus simplex]ULM96760.1 hypothetical protein L8956_23870 [Peribacillus frigoritolerans]